MVKKVTKYEASDGTQWNTVREAAQRENKLALFNLLEPIATRGFYDNIHHFFDQNIDAICDIADSYRQLTVNVKKKKG